MDQGLEVMNCDGSRLPCVAFGAAYYGTDLVERAVLYNNGPETIKWVSVLDEGTAGEEAVSCLFVVTR